MDKCKEDCVYAQTKNVVGMTKEVKERFYKDKDIVYCRKCDRLMERGLECSAYEKRKELTEKQRKESWKMVDTEHYDKIRAGNEKKKEKGKE